MSNRDKINVLLGLSNDIRTFLDDRKIQFQLSENTELEVLIYTLFNILNDKVKEGVIPKEQVEKHLRTSLNTYIGSSNLDLIVQPLNFPTRFKTN